MSPQERRKGRLTILLALTGGWVDAVGYIVLFQVFTAHMSGNSVAFAVHLGEGNWSGALQHGFPIPVFMFGLALGTALHWLLIQSRARSTYALVLALECVLLVLFGLLAQPLLHDGALGLDFDVRYYLIVALPALAMGLQNATLRRVNGQNVPTTFITGVLTHFTEKLVEYLLWRTGRHDTRPSGGNIALLGCIWLGYVVGGLMGVVMHLRWQLWCILPPVLCLLITMVYDLIRPLDTDVGGT